MNFNRIAGINEYAANMIQKNIYENQSSKLNKEHTELASLLEMNKKIEKGNRISAICIKMHTGKLLSKEEKRILQNHSPELAYAANRVEREVRTLRKKIQRCKTIKDKKRTIVNRKLQLLVGGKKDTSLGFILPAIDNMYRTTT